MTWNCINTTQWRQNMDRADVNANINDNTESYEININLDE